PMPASTGAPQLRQMIQELGAEAVALREKKTDLLHLRFLETAKKNRGKFYMADISGKELTFGKALMGSLVLSRWIRRNYPGQEMIGLMLPSSIGGVLVNLAVAMAVAALRSEQARKIVLVRPAVEAGEKLGYLPGDLQAKVNPYLRPLFDAMHAMMPFEQARRFLHNDVIEIVPLAFMRGRTLNNAVVILDEAQNTTAAQMLMFLTRLGHHSKMIVTGDDSQSDLAEDERGGLGDAISRLEGIEGVAVVRLTKEDIVRHPMVQKVVEAYEGDKPDAR
ncbi:MAG: PhoH family protein, partial [Planctomycetes bacterium]|nr:PhoH family protein [Planctomycetota bacterium]